MIKIFGHEYEVRYRDMQREGDDYRGKSITRQNFLEIAACEPTSQQEDTFIHEIIHALSYLLKLDMKENLVHRLAAALHTVIKDNPDIFTMKLPRDKKGVK